MKNVLTKRECGIITAAMQFEASKAEHGKFWYTANEVVTLLDKLRCVDWDSHEVLFRKVTK